MTAVAIGLSCTLALARAGAAGCPPMAVVSGDAPIVEPVRAILRAHALATEVGACAEPAVRASLIAAPGVKGYVLRIEDPYGRKSERRVADAETAASLIETWALPATELVRAPSPATASARAQIADETNAPAATSADGAGRWRLTGALEVAGSSDDSLWYGSAVTACGPIGAFCMGGRLRIARADDIVDLDHDSSARSAVELLAVAALPLAARGWTVMPMIGVGLGWIRTGAPPPGDDVDTPPGDDLGLRIEAAVSAGRQLNRHLTLVGELGASRGWSIASSTVSATASVTPRVASYLRAAVALQYSP